jgi:hypothetical protein
MARQTELLNQLVQAQMNQFHHPSCGRDEHPLAGYQDFLSTQPPLFHKTDLLLLDLEGMDVLLGMDWMTRHRVSLDISSRAVEIDSPDHETAILYLPQRECNNSCAYAVEGIKLKDIPIVCEYPDVFLDDLPGIPPDRDIEFIIELQPGTAPISKRPYRMPPNELAELKIQL